MKINSMEISDFFQQLALLTRSELPLPETLRQLAANSKHSDIKNMIEECGEAAGQGMKLSDALQKYTGQVPPFYIRMIMLGEQEGTLPEVLSELAKIARMHHQLTTMIKDIMLYPLITISFAFLIFLFLALWIIPEFHKIYIELLEGASLPPLTDFVISFFTFIRNYSHIFVTLYLVYLGAMIWFFCNRHLANRLLLYLVRHFPFAEVVFYNYAMSRLCTMWATMMRRRIPAEEAFPAIAEIMDFSPLANALNRISKACGNGVGFQDALALETDISQLLIMTVKNTQENKLPEQLEQLAELFQERGSYGFRKAGMAWELISIMGMVIIIGGILFLLFLPFLMSFLH